MDGQFIKYAVLMLALVDLSKCYPIIKTEHELINTCTRNCYQIHTVFDKFGCDRVDHCGLASTGWTRGFHRCDYCQCECITDNPRIEHVEDMIKNYYTFRATEPQLYGTCTNTCDKGGLVRTNYGRCDEVRDCRTQSRGWTRGFVRCDYCVCDCVEYAYAATYTMKNFEFSLGDIDTNKNTPSDVYLGEVIVHNSESSEQVVSKTITTTLRSTSSWAMGESLSWGVSVNMEVGIGIDGFSLSRGIEVGTGGTFTYEVGSEISQEVSIATECTLVIPGGRSMKCTVLGRRFRTKVPFSATLETTFTNGETKNQTVQGAYKNVTVALGNVDIEPV